tara:strand:+ start:1068 stop:1790 length:723 start_codon:yes stop_codon:yes gene_type:complete
MHGLFVTGTDTAVGKTHVATIIIRTLIGRGVRVGGYKPVASGIENGRWADIDALSAALDDQFPLERICPQTFEAPLAPPEAARAEGSDVDRDLLISGSRWWSEQVDMLVVEGVGGLLCPLTESSTIAELAVELNFPLVIVARNGLGVINHTLLTIATARQHRLPIAGVVLNHPSPADPADPSLATNADVITRFGDVPLLGSVPYQGTDLLADHATATIDWLALAQATPSPTAEQPSCDDS